MKRFLLVALASTVSTSAFAIPVVDFTIPSLRGGHLLHYVDLGFESIPSGTASSTASAATTAAAPAVVPFNAATFAGATFTSATNSPVLPMVNNTTTSFYGDNFLPGLAWNLNLGQMIKDITRQLDETKTSGGTTPTNPTVVTGPETTVSVPEPGTLGLMLLSGLVFLGLRRRLPA